MHARGVYTFNGNMKLKMTMHKIGLNFFIFQILFENVRDYRQCIVCMMCKACDDAIFYI